MITSFLIILGMGFTLGISGAMIPGPLTLFCVSEVLKTNKLAGLKVVLGHIVIEFIMVCVIVFGFSRFLSSRIFLAAASSVGGVALIMMGVLLLSRSGSMKLSDINTDARYGRGLIAGGILFSMSSPGFIVWWATIGLSTIVKVMLVGVIGIVVFMVGHWLADILWFGLLSCMVDRGKVYLSDRLYQNIMRFFSILLFVFGIYFLMLKL